jgi:hypothetical protein
MNFIWTGYLLQPTLHEAEINHITNQNFLIVRNIIMPHNIQLSLVLQILFEIIFSIVNN